jgi:DNA-binding transcriptional regulator YiaG
VAAKSLFKSSGRYRKNPNKLLVQKSQVQLPSNLRVVTYDERSTETLCQSLDKSARTWKGIPDARGEITLKTTTLELPDRPPAVEAEEVTNLRLKNGMSQAVFAQVLNVSTKTVQSWEQGQRKPWQAALRLIQVFRQNQSGLLEIVELSSWNHGSHR